MQIAATVTSSAAGHAVAVRTGESSQSLPVPRRVDGPGSGVNGGEFLMLALATCYCNDLFREAKRLGIPIEGAQVEATAEFPGIGLAAVNITYRATIQSSASRPTCSACCAKPTRSPRCTTPCARGCRCSCSTRPRGIGSSRRTPAAASWTMSRPRLWPITQPAVVPASFETHGFGSFPAVLRFTAGLGAGSRAQRRRPPQGRSSARPELNAASAARRALVGCDVPCGRPDSASPPYIV